MSASPSPLTTVVLKVNILKVSFTIFHVVPCPLEGVVMVGSGGDLDEAQLFRLKIVFGIRKNAVFQFCSLIFS